MRFAVAVTGRAAVFSLVWAALGSWGQDYILYGLVSVLAATALSIALIPPGDLRVRQWPRRALGVAALAGWFLRKAVHGGMDVSLRAVRSAPDVDPVVVTAPLRLPPGHARGMALLLMNLMPGSMVQRVVGDDVELHTLSASLKPAQQWDALQRRVGIAFGVDPGVRGPRGTDAGER